MYATDLASRRRTVDIPAKPEAGLAEWTSRIKALQKQVDDDEEAETRRLEEEIAASRLARMRRSAGRGTSVDLANTDVAQSLRELPTATPSEDTPVDRQQQQSDTLKKLSGENATIRQRESAPGPRATPSKAPMSLAAFMGGKATGPRLNRHAPQVDAHDPTQFEQRTITAPHPVFGRGGVAMPGMSGKAHVQDRASDEPPAKPTVVQSRERKASTPHEGVSPIRALVQNAEERRRAATPQKASNGSNADTFPRQRTISTPSAPPPMQSTVSSWKREPLRDQSLPLPVNRPTTPGNQPPPQSVPRSGRHTPTRSTTPAQSARSEHAFSPPQPQARTPQHTSSSPIPKSPAMNNTPGLAKPIQPTPRKSYQGPDIPIAQNQSPVYMRTPSAKEPTPSISRLQGRGFVQSMVRASTQVEAASPSSAGSPSASVNEKARKTSVLDRWQFGNDSPPPIIAPKPEPLKKSRTVDPSLATPASPTFTPPPVKVIHTGKSLKSVASLPSIQQAAAAQTSGRSSSTRSEVGADASPSQKRGLGSSTTMISYIKPLKTGDNPPTSAPPSRPPSAASRSRAASPDVDELGIRRRSRTRSISAAGAALEASQERGDGASTGKPLSHPTKDRARKPKKAKTSVKQVPLKSDPDNSVERKPDSLAHPTHDVVTPAVVEERLSRRKSSPPATIVDSPSEDMPAGGQSRRVHFPLEVPVDPPLSQEKSRHSRIPSTGNRATVMDVAQALQQHEEQVRRFSGEDREPKMISARDEQLAGSTDLELSFSGVARRQVQVSKEEAVVAPPLEKRKSSYEKYSAFVMPPLLEVRTPVQSPAGTLSRNPAQPSSTSRLDVSVADESQPSAKSDPPLPEDSQREEVGFVRFEHNDEPLPRVDVAALFNSRDPPYVPLGSDVQTISVEVMAIQGNTATALTTDSNVFYDSEVLIIISRLKTRSSGLVSTKVWAWQGNKSQLGEREEKKLQDLARRYNTPLVMVSQCLEPIELVHVLGGQLAIRQGLRGHWSSENTAMHLVRCLDGVIFIDELEPGIKKLCSGFSYCLSLLETFYVWHGRGSRTEEREAALKYAQSLSSSPDSVIELVEGQSDQEEMFWLILGDGDYAKADYWQWRSSSDLLSARVWQVNSSVDRASEYLSVVRSFGGDPSVHSSVYICDCNWEFFVLVGSEARGKRKDIRLALSVADEMSAIAAPSRPFPPTVHALILPSQLPVDLLFTFRGLDESLLNKGNIPDHMNLIPSSLAFEHLQRSSWQKEVLKDSTMLPLGLQSVS